MFVGFQHHNTQSARFRSHFAMNINNTSTLCCIRRRGATGGRCSLRNWMRHINPFGSGAFRTSATQTLYGDMLLERSFCEDADTTVVNSAAHHQHPGLVIPEKTGVADNGSIRCLPPPPRSPELSHISSCCAAASSGDDIV